MPDLVICRTLPTPHLRQSTLLAGVELYQDDSGLIYVPNREVDTLHKCGWLRDNLLTGEAWLKVPYGPGQSMEAKCAYLAFDVKEAVLRQLLQSIQGYEHAECDIAVAHGPHAGISEDERNRLQRRLIELRGHLTEAKQRAQTLLGENF